MGAPPAAAESAFLSGLSELVHRVEIYEADGTTRWMGGENDDRLVDGSVNIDYSRDERRGFDLVLDNEDFGLEHTPEKFWYDKIIKIYSGIKYTDTTPVISYATRDNIVYNPLYAKGTSVVEMRRNLAINPSCDGSGGWNANNSAVSAVVYDSAVKRSGLKSARGTLPAGVTTNSLMSLYDVGGGPFTVTPGENITVSAYFAHNCSSDVEATIYISWLDASNQNISTTPIVWKDISGGAIFPASNRLSATGVAISTAVKARVITQARKKVGTVASTEYAWVDDCLIERASVVLPYFDGNTPTDAADGWTYVWTGTAGASESGQRSFEPLLGAVRRYNPSGVAGAPIAGNVLRTFTKNALTSSIVAYQDGLQPPGEVGAYYAVRIKARLNTAWQSTPTAVNLRAMLGVYDTTFAGNLTVTNNYKTLPTDGSWVELTATSTSPVPAGLAAPTVRALVYTDVSANFPPGTIIEYKDPQVEKVSGPGKLPSVAFSGATQNFANRTYTWMGTANASASRETIKISTPTAVPTTWETQVGEFMIDKISERHFPYTVSVSGRDYTKKCILSKFLVSTTFVSGSSIENTIRVIAQGAGITKFLLPATGRSLGKDYNFERGVSRWEAMKQIADAFGYEMFFDAQGYLVIREYLDPVNAPLAYTLATGPDIGNLVEYEKSLNDSRIYNHILVTGESQDTEVPPVWAEARNDEPSSPSRIARLGDRLFEYSSPFITTTAQAQDVAKKFLQIHSLEEFDLNFSSIALPWLEVGEIVMFVDPRPSAGQPDRFLLSSLSIPLGLGAMSGNGKRVSVVG